MLLLLLPTDCCFELYCRATLDAAREDEEEGMMVEADSIEVMEGIEAMDAIDVVDDEGMSG